MQRRRTGGGEALAVDREWTWGHDAQRQARRSVHWMERIAARSPLLIAKRSYNYVLLELEQSAPFRQCLLYAAPRPLDLSTSRKPSYG